MAVSRSRVQSLQAEIDALKAAQNPPISVAIFRGEDTGFAIARHLAIRPEHRGRPCKFERRHEYRSVAFELCAAFTHAELSDAIEAATNHGVSGGFIVDMRGKDLSE